MGRLPDAEDGSGEEMVGEALSAVECVAVNELIEKFGLDSRDGIKLRYDALRRNLLALGSRRPLPDTPGFIYYVLRYLRAALEQPPNHWKVLHQWFIKEWPTVAVLGDQLKNDMNALDRGTPSGRKATYELLIDSLDIRGSVVIYNRKTGEQF